MFLFHEIFFGGKIDACTIFDQNGSDATRKGKIGRMQEMITDISLPRKLSKSGDIHHDQTCKYICMYSSKVGNR